MLCNLQIFPGCVCHLEQLHAQSPFLFPIVFIINLIPFFDICSVLAVLSPGLFGYLLLYIWATARSQQLMFVVLTAGLWCFTAGCHVKSPLLLFPNPLSNRSVLHDGRKHKTAVSSQPNALREEARNTNLPLLAIGCHADCSGERRTSPFNAFEKLLSRAVAIKTKSPGLEKSAAMRPFATKKSRLASEKTLLADSLATESCRLADRLATKIFSKRTTPMRTERDRARCVAVFKVVGSRCKEVGRSGPVDRVCE